MINRYRKKPVIVEAILYDGTNWDEVKKFEPSIRVNFSGTRVKYWDKARKFYHYLERVWIIRDEGGRIYLRMEESFNKNYERVIE